MGTHSIFHQAGASRCRARWKDMQGSERARLCPSCHVISYRVDELSEDQIKELISVDTRFTKLICAEPLGQEESVPKLYRRTDGTYATSDVVCPQSEIHDPWCSWDMTRKVLGGQCAMILACFLFGLMMAGLGFALIAPLTVVWTFTQAISQLWMKTFWLMIPAFAVAFYKRPRVLHPCHFLSLSPLLSTVLLVLWCGVWNIVRINGFQSLTWTSYVAGAMFLLSSVFSAFLWSIYKGQRLFFGVVLVFLLVLQFLCLWNISGLGF